jgi:hypothetical protein
MGNVGAGYSGCPISRRRWRNGPRKHHRLRSGIPTGQPNSMVLMSSPIRLRSSREGEAFQPFPNRLSAGLSPVKDGLDAFTLQVGLGAFFALGPACGYLPQPIVPHTVHKHAFLRRLSAPQLRPSGLKYRGICGQEEREPPPEDSASHGLVPIFPRFFR